MRAGKWFKVCVILLAGLASSAQAANILAMFLIPSYSHQMPLLCLSKALAARGHNLTVITANPSEVPIANHTEIDLSFLYAVFRNGSLGFTVQTRKTPVEIFKESIPGVVKMTEIQLTSPQIQNFLSWAKDVKFDLVLYENMITVPFLAMAHVLGSPPVVGVATIVPHPWFDAAMGAETNPAYVPASMETTDHMTFFERIHNIYFIIVTSYYRYWIAYPLSDQVIKKVFGEGLPSAYELDRNKSLLMYSCDPVMSYPKPLPPNVVLVGPMHIVPPKPLPEDLKSWVQGAKDGVIYFSLGSNMQGTSLPEEKRNAFLDAFARFPNYHIIWKWETDMHFPGQAENIKFKKWIPQQDLLAHGKVKVFISQCGLQSVQEAIHYGVTLICIPFFGDQDHNSLRVVTLGSAIQLDYIKINKETVFKALKEILYNPRYRDNMQQLSAVFKDRVLSPVDMAIWWVEYVLHHRGAKHLRPASLDLHWTQYIMLDVAVFIVGIISVAVFLVYKLIRITSRSILKQSKTKTKVQ